MNKLNGFLKDCEDQAITAKACWNSLCMHPNDQCEEVLILVKLVRRLLFFKTLTPEEFEILMTDAELIISS